MHSALQIVFFTNSELARGRGRRRERGR